MKAALVALLFLGAQTLRPAPLSSDDWTRPFPAVHIVGNVYYVGTWDLSSYLITTPQGHILINTGLASSTPQIRRNIESLGFRLADVKLLMATHAHWDHVAALAELKQLTGARMLIHEADAALLEDGGRSDFRFGGPDPTFAPVKVDQRLKDGDVVRLGGTNITVHHHPGHTKGAASFTLTVRDGCDYRVVIANMGSINPGVTVRGMATYPRIGADYARTFTAQKALPVDIFLASHASQFDLHRKYTPGDAYDPARFVDPQGYYAAVGQLEKTFLAQLSTEQAAARE